MKYINLDNQEDLRKNIGFHFTSNDKETLEKILHEGLALQMGENSSNSEAVEATKKVFFSYGLQGAIRLFNTFINNFKNGKISYFEAESYKKCIPNSARNKSGEESLTEIEAFEMFRQYMSDKTYLVLNATPTKYERSISSEQLNSINRNIKNTQEGIEYKKIDEDILTIKQDNSISQIEKEEMIEKLVEQKRELSLKIRSFSEAEIDNQRGELVGNTDGIFDEVDYDEAKIEWKNNIESAYNIHTKMIEKNGMMCSKNVIPEGVASVDGQNPASAIEVIEKLYSYSEPSDKLVAKKEPFVVDKFLEYNRIVEKYKENGLLISRSSTDKTLVMDLNDMSKYPELEEKQEKNEFLSNLRSGVKNESEVIAADVEREESIEKSKQEKTSEINEKEHIIIK